MTAVYPRIYDYFLVNVTHELSDSLATVRLSKTIDPIYCIISNSSCVTLVIYSLNNLPTQLKRCIRFQSTKAKKVSQLLQLHKYICDNLSISHSIYIGMELIKVELAIMLNQPFIQD